MASDSSPAAGADRLLEKDTELDVLRATLPAGYHPGDDEPFMNERQLTYFKIKLLQWKETIKAEAKETLSNLKAGGPLQEPDQTDRASSETDLALELRTRDRQRKLIAKIDAALQRIDDGEYGFCEITGEPIALSRLEARPVATMTIEAQEQHERQERVTRDQND